MSARSEPDAIDWVRACRSSLRRALRERELPAGNAVLDFVVPQILDLEAGTAATRRLRRAEQRLHLEMLGFLPLEARQALRTLALPDAPVAAEHVITPHVYHPVRVQSFAREHPALRESMAGFVPHAGDPGTDPRHPLNLLIDRALVNPADTPLPWDRSVLQHRLIAGVHGMAEDVLDTTGGILDIEAVLDHYRDRTPAGIDLTRIRPGSQRYVHFGRDALPSPYPGLGIEGCYILRNGSDGADAAFLLTPVISEPRPCAAAAADLLEQDPAAVLLGHSRAICLQYDLRLTLTTWAYSARFTALPEDRTFPLGWQLCMPAVIRLVAAALDDLHRGASPARAIGPDPDADRAPGHAGAARPIVFGDSPVSAQYPDDGGGFPLDPRYWPTQGLAGWITGYLATANAERRPATADTGSGADKHGWIDRAVRLIQQAIPDRTALPDLQDRPALRPIVQELLIQMPVAGASLMPFWQALRWLGRINPLAMEMRIHALLVESIATPPLREVGHILIRELPKEPVVRRYWADLAQCLADAEEYPPAEDNIAGLTARAYLADPDLGERILARGCTPATMAQRGIHDAADPDLTVLCVYGGVLRGLVRSLPDTMTLLRAPTGIKH